MSERVETFYIGSVHITRGESWVVSRWKDGTELHAHPDGSDLEAARAESLGYKGSNAVGEMTRDHDVLHHLLAHARGDTDGSDLLLRAGRGIKNWLPEDEAWAQQEEATVLLMARLMNVGIEECLP